MAGSKSNQSAPIRRSAWLALLVFDQIVWLAAAIGAALLGCIFLSVIFDVTARQLVRHPPSWPVPASEYALHVAVVLGAPYILQLRGHVVVDILLRLFPIRMQHAVSFFTTLLAALVCAFFAYLSGKLGLDAWQKGYTDVRAIALPQYILFAPMSLSFGLMAIQFCRIAFGPENDRTISSAEV